MIYVYVKGGFKFKCLEAYGNGDDALNSWMSDLSAPDSFPSYDEPGEGSNKHLSNVMWTLLNDGVDDAMEWSGKNEFIPPALINIAQSLYTLETGSYGQARKEIVVFLLASTGKEIVIRCDDIVAITDAGDK